MRAVRGRLIVVLLVELAVQVAACGGENGAARSPVLLPLPVADTCATRLPPRDADADASALPPLPPPRTPSSFAAPRSTVVVNADVPLAGLRQALEAKVPRRVAEERDHDLGPAGHLEYTVDRGPFAVRVENGIVVVESTLQGRAQACAKGRCYAGCAPEARITAKVPLHLGADYKLRSSEVRVDITRGCEVRALGGLLTIDVTPIVRGALAQQSRNVQASIDRELPDLRPQAARLWTELGKTRELPLGMCIVPGPEEITQGLATGNATSARLRFGLIARPELRARCVGAAAATPPPLVALPPLRDDPALPAAGDVHLAIVLPDDAPARALERDVIVDFGGRRSRVNRASGDLAASLLLDLGGEVCGDVVLSAAGVAWNDPQSLRVIGVAPLPGESERLASAGLDAARIAPALERAPIALPIAVAALPSTLPELAAAMSDDHVTVAVTVERAQPESAGLRGAEPIAVALLRGAVTLHAK
jgi:hypothetical protein